MSAYLKFFELEQSPFEGNAQTQVVLGTKALRGAFALIRGGLDEGDARICVSGGHGLGKTSLARALPKLLGDSARVAVVLDPEVSWHSLRGSISKQWGLADGGLARNALIEAARDRRLVIVIDQAERASQDFLDHLDIILCYRSENDEPVVQSVLFARLSSDSQQEPAPILWWLDRIQTLQLEFAPLPRDGVDSYIRKHLKRAGWRGERLFTKEAALAIHGVTGGVPGEVSRLCERLLADAAARDRCDIDEAFVHSRCDDDGTDGRSGLENENEEIALVEECDAANTAAHSEPATVDLQETISESAGPPTLAETLEHFETDEAQKPEESAAETIAAAQDEPSDESFAWDQEDETLAFRDDSLSAPASPEELRAILGGVFGHSGRAFAAALIAAVIGGLGIAWWIGNSPGPSKSIASGGPELARPETVDATGSGLIIHSESPPAILARLRGPVSTTGSTTPAPSAPARSRSAPRATDATTFEIADEDLEDESSENTSIDPRPASMLPYSAENSQVEERSW